MTSVKDVLLKGIDLEEVITTVQCNEPIINEEVVRKVFKEILALQLEDAYAALEENMTFILNQSKL